jgi:excisionase family DNA binding protein
MNPAVLQDFNEALQLVAGDKVAAANLALASALRGNQAVALSTNTPLTVPEVAKHLRVRRTKVLSWIRSGRLRGYNIAERENGRPKYRVNLDDLQVFVQKRDAMQPAPVGRPPRRLGGDRLIPQPKWKPH